MPARLSSMELSSPSNPDLDASAQPSRRRSGRVASQRVALSPSGSAKRKHSEINGLASDSSDNDDSEEEPDEEEIRELKKKARGRANAPSKRTKKTVAITSLPIRPAVSSKRKAPKGRGRIPNDAAKAFGGLYADVFGEDKDLDKVASDWIGRFKEDEAVGLAEVINFVLYSCGCSITIDVHDINDPDNCANRLTDIQEEFQAQNNSDYPLIAKKGAIPFKKTLTAFINIWIKTIATDGSLYETPELVENVQVWISSMSSAASRPFRHTSTLIALEIVNSLCEIGRSLIDSRAATLKQQQSESKKARVNRERVKDLEKQAELYADRSVQLESVITDWYNTVFVHRYKDIDHRIRQDCVAYLGEWMSVYPDHFFEAQYQKYLGWELSDQHAPCRQETIKQLTRLYKDEAKLAGFGHFTERFRPRMIEMATQDAEPNVRVDSLELLDILREAGMLEPDDIDTVGKLIYDSESRIRKAVVDFFVASVKEIYDLKIEDLGGLEAIADVMNSPIDDDYESPRVEWVRLKCLAELMLSYDQGTDDTKTIERRPGDANDILFAAGIESRFSLAAEAVWRKFTQAHDWEVLAGLLLFDHSNTPNGESHALSGQLRDAYRLSSAEEMILLDTLNVAVKDALDSTIENATDKKAKKTKAELRKEKAMQEHAAQNLAMFIPKLLKKFGAAPEAASAVLRLEQVFKLDVFEELRQDSATFSQFLDDINRQFLSHEKQDVLAEARKTLLYAKSFEELQEVTEDKVQALWEDVTFNLVSLTRAEDMTTRGNIDRSILSMISAATLRIANLSSIADCSKILRKPRTTISDKPRRKQREEPPVAPVGILLDSVFRGMLAEDTDSDTNAIEDEIFRNASKALFFYFLWNIKSLKSNANISVEDVEQLVEHRNAFVTALRSVVLSRGGTDELRLDAASKILDIHTMSMRLRDLTELDATDPGLLSELARPLKIDDERHISKVFLTVERDFAKRSGRALEDAAEDDLEPEETDDEVDEDEDGDEAAHLSSQRLANRKHREALLAEERLCSLTGRIVLALAAGAIKSGADRDRHEDEYITESRLSLNEAKLGPNFKAVLAQLHPVEQKKKGRKKKDGATLQSKPKATPKVASHKRSEDVVIESDDEDAEAEAEQENVDEQDDRVNMMDEDEDEIRDIARSPEAESMLGD